MTLSASKSVLSVVNLSRSAGLFAIAAMVATPLFGRGGAERRWLAYAVVCGFFVAAVSAHWLVSRWRSIFAASVVMIASLAVEVVGSRTGVPFGEYDYGSVLQPTLFGVPVLV
ncbi:MAG: carotenoid biosynthesis protein, partial [Actinobacteria bacterium]|nr:carotenoid biosynthesis protein [Actinomycetota bacterium]